MAYGILANEHHADTCFSEIMNNHSDQKTFENNYYLCYGCP